MDVLHHDLETIECACFSPADFVGEIHNQVLVDNTIACSKESKDVLEEMLLIFVELFPIFHVLCKIDFFCGPERCSMLLVHSPNIIMLNWEKDKAIKIFLKHWFNVFSR